MKKTATVVGCTLAAAVVLGFAVWWNTASAPARAYSALIVMYLIAACWAWVTTGRINRTADWWEQAADDTARLLEDLHRLVHDLHDTRTPPDPDDRTPTTQMHAVRTDTDETTALMTVDAILGRLRQEQGGRDARR